MTLSNQPRTGENIWLNISESFDDISAAANVIYTISLDDEVISERNGVSFASAINTSLPEMSVGNHQILIEATDEAGNSISTAYTSYTFREYTLESKMDLKLVQAFRQSQCFQCCALAVLE